MYWTQIALRFIQFLDRKLLWEEYYKPAFFHLYWHFALLSFLLIDIPFKKWPWRRFSNSRTQFEKCKLCSKNCYDMTFLWPPLSANFFVYNKLADIHWSLFKGEGCFIDNYWQMATNILFKAEVLIQKVWISQTISFSCFSLIDWKIHHSHD